MSNRCVVVFNDTLYNFGGRTNYNSPVYTHDGLSITPNLRTGANETTLPTTNRIGLAFAIYTPDDGPAMIVIAGGFQSINAGNYTYVFQSTSSQPNVRNEAYYLQYPFTVTWLSADTYDYSLGFASAAVYGSNMYCFGGVTSSAAAPYITNPYNFVYSLDLSNIATASWTSCNDMPRARFGHVAVTINQ
jgi:hypothetical protein